MNWEELSEGLDGQSIVFFKDQESGDEIEVRDRYSNPISLAIRPGKRYRVVYDRNSGVPCPDLSGDFSSPEEALEYAGSIIGEDLEGYL